MNYAKTPGAAPKSKGSMTQILLLVMAILGVNALKQGSDGLNPFISLVLNGGL